MHRANNRIGINTLSRMKHVSSASRGQGLVEFALVLVFLVMVAFGVLDLSRAFYALITITNAAREGARYGIMYPSATSAIQAAAVNEAANSGISLDTTNVVVQCGNTLTAPPCARGQALRVTVSYNYTLLLNAFLPLSYNMSRYVEMLVP